MMSEPTYPLELIRAELKAAMSDLKVDLMERFVSKRDLADFRSDFILHQAEDDKHFTEINGKLDTLLAEKIVRDGVVNDHRYKLSRRDFWIGVIVTLSIGLVAGAATLFANFVS